MFRGRYMRDPAYICLPPCVLRVHRSRDQEGVLRKKPRRPIQKLHKLCLAVRCVRSQIAKIAAEFFAHGSRHIEIRVNRTVKRKSPFCTKAGLKLLERRTSCKAEVSVVKR